MADPEIVRRVAHVHQTLEPVAFPLAVLFGQPGGFRTLVGAGAVPLLIANVLARFLGDSEDRSIAG